MYIYVYTYIYTCPIGHDTIYYAHIIQVTSRVWCDYMYMIRDTKYNCYNNDDIVIYLLVLYNLRIFKQRIYYRTTNYIHL